MRDRSFYGPPEGYIPLIVIPLFLFIFGQFGAALVFVLFISLPIFCFTALVMIGDAISSKLQALKPQIFKHVARLGHWRRRTRGP